MDSPGAKQWYDDVDIDGRDSNGNEVGWDDPHEVYVAIVQPTTPHIPPTRSQLYAARRAELMSVIALKQATIARFNAYITKAESDLASLQATRTRLGSEVQEVNKWIANLEKEFGINEQTN